MFNFVEINNDMIISKGSSKNLFELPENYLEVTEEIYNKICKMPCGYTILDGQIVQVEYIENGSPLEELKQEKIQQLKLQCNQTILSGFNYNNEHYNLDYEDQINMEAIKNNLLLGLMTECEYYPSGQPCRIYTKEEFLALYSTGMTFKTSNIQRCKALIEKVENATTKEEINAINW